MHADLKAALEQLNTSYKAFEHRGQKMSKDQVRKVLKYGIDKGYKTTAEFSDDEVDEILAVKFHPAFLPDGTFIGTVQGAQIKTIYKQQGTTSGYDAEGNEYYIKTVTNE